MTESNNKLKKTTVEISAELQRRVRMKEGDTFQDGCIKACEAWVASQPAPPRPLPDDTTAAIIDWFHTATGPEAKMAELIVSFIFGGKPRPLSEVEDEVTTKS